MSQRDRRQNAPARVREIVVGTHVEREEQHEEDDVGAERREHHDEDEKSPAEEIERDRLVVLRRNGAASGLESTGEVLDRLRASARKSHPHAPG